MHFKIMIQGAGAPTGKIEVTSPFDGKVVGSVDAAGADSVEKALSTAYALFKDRKRWLPKSDRIQILKKTIQIMTTEKENLAKLAASEGGKPLVDSLVEVQRAIEGLECCIETIKTIGGTEIPMNLNPASSGKLAFTSLDPVGVVAAISAFNHPLNLIIHQVAPAIITGCPVIVKPAEDTPLSCMRFIEILRQAGLPEEFCQGFVVNQIENATLLVKDSRLSFFTFIGSAKVGWHLKSLLAPGVHCALEHGGAAPVIVDQDADWNMMIPKLVKGGFYHAGQVCVSVQRVFAHESVAEKLAMEISNKAKALVVGDALDPKTEVGPLIRHRETDRIDSWVQEAIEKGAKLLCGGKKISNSCYSPTVLLNPPDDCKVSKEEIFGPVICVYSYQSFESAIEKANSVPFSFQAAVFSNNLNQAMFAYRNLEAKAVMINEHTAFRVDWMPFGGEKLSGLGTGGIPYTVRDMLSEKMMVISSGSL
jgi:acyl-CoA reductase-like NAD-dependent aldehyde dehydrogenase